MRIILDKLASTGAEKKEEEREEKEKKEKE